MGNCLIKKKNIVLSKLKLYNTDKTIVTNTIVSVANGKQYFCFRAGLTDGTRTVSGMDIASSFDIVGGSRSGIASTMEGHIGVANDSSFAFKRTNSSGWNTSFALEIDGDINDTFHNETSWNCEVGEYFLIASGGDFGKVNLTGATKELEITDISYSWQTLYCGGYVCLAKATSTTIVASGYGTSVQHISLGKRVEVI